MTYRQQHRRNTARCPGQSCHAAKAVIMIIVPAAHCVHSYRLIYSGAVDVLTQHRAVFVILGDHLVAVVAVQGIAYRVLRIIYLSDTSA